VSTTEKEDESLTVHRPDAKGEDEEWPWWRLEATDPARFAAGVDAFHRAAQKPYYRSYAGEVLNRKLSAIPVRRLADVWVRFYQDMRPTDLLSYNVWRTAGRCAVAATEAAMAGRRDQAERLLRDLRLVETMTVRDWDGQAMFLASDELADQ